MLKARFICFAFVGLSNLSSAQLLDNRSILPGGIRDLEHIDTRIPQALNEIYLPPLIDLDNRLPDPLLARKLDTLGDLPKRLSINTPLNRVVLTEVEVENGWRAVEREWIVLADSALLTQLSSLNLHIMDNTPLPALKLNVVRVRVNIDMDNYAQIRALLQKANADSAEIRAFDRNHVFEAQSIPTTYTAPTQLKTLSSSPLRIGLIDTAIEKTHPALAESTLFAASFVKAGLDEASAHGTSVASIIVAKGKGFLGLLPNAELYAASVFYKRSEHRQGATSLSLLKALDWLLSQKVKVINMSLAGPPNTLLEQALKNAEASGVYVVAAVGNEGPAASPRFPAAYTSVIAVTATDADEKIYRWAIRGDHVDFAAKGVAVKVARIPNGEGFESGTSLAAPVVTAMLAVALQESSFELALQQLKTKAKDLGPHGWDKVFGYGYLDPYNFYP